MSEQTKPAIANYAVADDIRTYAGHVVYRLSPAPGARIAGIVDVSVTSRDNSTYCDVDLCKIVKAEYPAMAVDLAVNALDEREHIIYRDGFAWLPEPLTISGRRVESGFAYVEFQPGESNYADMSDVTLLGEAGRFQVKYAWGDLTDSARRTLAPILCRIAAEYLTDVRVLETRLNNALQARQKAEIALREAREELAQANLEYDRIDAQLAAAKAEASAVNN